MHEEKQRLCYQTEEPESTSIVDSEWPNLTLPRRAPTLTPMDSDDDEPTKPTDLGATVETPAKKAQQKASEAMGNALFEPFTASSTELPSRWATNTNTHPDIAVDHDTHLFTKLGDPASTSGTAFGSNTKQFPTQISGTDPNDMSDIKYDTGDESSQARLPSPISDDEVMETAIPSESDLMHYSPRDVSMTPDFPSESSKDSDISMQPVRKQPPPRSTTSFAGARKTPRVMMGYRADCEKCRAREPGHYIHILRN